MTSRIRSQIYFAMLGMVAIPVLSFAQQTLDEPSQSGRSRRNASHVYKSEITPHWLRDSERFWYRNDLSGGRREYIFVDAVAGIRKLAFEHERLASALLEHRVEVVGDRLDLDILDFDIKPPKMVFQHNGKTWNCDLESYALTLLDADQRAKNDGLLPELPLDAAPRSSRRTGSETELRFVNQTAEQIALFWLDGNGRRRAYGRVPAGQSHSQHTYAGHVWLVVDSRGNELAIFKAGDRRQSATITPEMVNERREARKQPSIRQRSNRRPQDTSPDRKWKALIRDDNVVVREVGGDDEIQLSQDGVGDDTYGLLQWAPDSKTLVAFRISQGDRGEVYTIESSPKEGGRAKLATRTYRLPGDRFEAYELNLFDMGSRTQIKPKVDRIDFGRPRIRFNRNGDRFTYEKVDRGHQRFRLIQIQCEDGRARNIIDEKSDTFIWSAHAQSRGVRLVTWLEQSNEIIYLSERDGWRHLYLVDADTGEIMNRITRGEWVTRGIDRIDEQKRQIWFRASGVYPGQDPYLIHHLRVDLDGKNLIALTEGNGSHSISFSPDRRFIVDSYSRVDMPPVHELRSTDRGELICPLEEADITDLVATGWRCPEVFSAKGRDDETSIWGIICRPKSVDPEHRYPIIEDIYAGPHSAYVPKTFLSNNLFSSLTDLGFIVVKMDGMGTAHRSKAFHDVCWQNLKDGGLPDRIRWIKAAAQKYPYMDIERVGIYGTSAGGQNAAAAVLFHPEFYRAAYAACGCHDNRMDKASWNEQFMGYPVGPHYAESSNIEHAYRLQGKLMLMVGELDTNVPPESTYRFADALIKADKDFDLVVMPGVGHSNGGSYGQRRMRDFFVRHLLETEPPDRNARN